MNVYGGAAEGFMSKQFLDRNKVCPTLIQVGCKTVTKGMCCYTLGPVQTFKMPGDKTAKKRAAHWLIPFFAWEKPSPRFPILIIIFR